MKGCIVIVGATGGLGQALAQRFAKEEESLVLVGRDQQKLAALLNELPPELGCITIVADVTRADPVQEIFAQLESRQLRPRVLINTVGKGVFGPVGSYSEVEIREALNANLLSAILIGQAGFQVMKADGGYIVNVISTAGLVGKAGESVYCAVKWGVRGFAEALRKEAKGTKVRVLSVFPGGMRTDFFHKAGSSQVVSSFMDPAEVADVIYHGVVSGQSLEVSELVINRK